MSHTAIGPRELARAAGVSTDTLRHYERKGLLPRVTRTAAGYRRYPEVTVERVLLIQRALVVGFSLDDLRRVLKIRDRGGAPCRSVRELVDQRLDGLNRRIDESIALRDELRDLMAEWAARLLGVRSGQQAHLLETLGTRTVIERARRSRLDAGPVRTAISTMQPPLRWPAGKKPTNS